MNKENLIIIAGMPRAGTSYMYQVLGNHPKVFMPIIKETNFFSYNQSKGIRWFENLYSEAKKEQKVFDISPFYFLDDTFFNNVKKFNKNQKIILLLRDPNDFVKSFYNQLKKQTYILPDFNDFVKDYELTFESNKFSLNFENFDFTKKIDKFIDTFESNLLLIDFNYFQNNKLTVLKEIENFINVEEYFNEDNILKEKVNAGQVNNSKLIAYLSTIDFLRDFAFKILPEKLIDYIRNKYILGVFVEKEEDDYPDIYKANLFKNVYFKEKSIYKC